MRHAVSLSLVLISCCSLIFSSSCGKNSENAKVDEVTEQPKNADIAPSPGVNKDKPAVPADQPPGVVPSTGGGGGGGGGSQGGERPADTGNPDNDPNHLPETICDDGIDNDNDGKKDCEDSDCNTKPCNDGDGCTLHDTCVAGICTGENVDCDVIVGKECAMNSCESISNEPGDDHFKCNSMLDPNKTKYGSCTPGSNCGKPRNPDGTCPEVLDQCVVGRCTTNTDRFIFEPIMREIRCEEANKIDLSTTEGGCKDGNTCHSYRCDSKDGECEYFLLHNIPCDDDNLCTKMDTCNMGECKGMNVPAGCKVDSDCAKGSTCRGVVQGTCAASGDACLTDTDCPLNACVDTSCTFGSETECDTNADCSNVCNPGTDGVCTCNDKEDCTTDDVCNDMGVCGGEAGPQTCDDNADCQSGSCDTQLNLCLCNDDNTCTYNDECSGNQCVGTPIQASCDDDGDCFSNSCILRGNCSITTSTKCSADGDCPSGETCANIVGRCACEDGIECTISGCVNGDCQIIDEDDDACSMNGTICTTHECTEYGCKATFMHGDMICGLTLAELSNQLATIINDANLIGLTCSIGQQNCNMGQPNGSCLIDEDFLPKCTEASLEAKCSINDIPQDISSNVATAICEALVALSNQ